MTLSLCIYHSCEILFVITIVVVGYNDPILVYLPPNIIRYICYKYKELQILGAKHAPSHSHVTQPLTAGVVNIS